MEKYFKFDNRLAEFKELCIREKQRIDTLKHIVIIKNLEKEKKEQFRKLGSLNFRIMNAENDLDRYVDKVDKLILKSPSLTKDDEESILVYSKKFISKFSKKPSSKALPIKTKAD